MNPSNDIHPLPPGFKDQEHALLREQSAVSSPQDPHIDAYRAVHRAVVAAPMPQPPADFAARIAAQVSDLCDNAKLEVLLQRLLMIASIIATLLFSAPYLLAAGADFTAWGHDLPLPMLLATGIGLAFAATIDRLAIGHRRTV